MRKLMHRRPAERVINILCILCSAATCVQPHNCLFWKARRRLHQVPELATKARRQAVNQSSSDENPAELQSEQRIEIDNVVHAYQRERMKTFKRSQRAEIGYAFATRKVQNSQIGKGGQGREVR
jgi:hypothetical protein